MTGTLKPGVVLAYGYDADLLETRRLVLVQAGYETVVVGSPEGFTEALQRGHHSISLAVVCHTVPLHERSRIEPIAIEHGVPLYQLTNLVPPSAFLEDVAAFLAKRMSIG